MTRNDGRCERPPRPAQRVHPRPPVGAPGVRHSGGHRRRRRRTRPGHPAEGLRGRRVPVVQPRRPGHLVVARPAGRHPPALLPRATPAGRHHPTEQVPRHRQHPVQRGDAGVRREPHRRHLGDRRDGGRVHGAAPAGARAQPGGVAGRRTGRRHLRGERRRAVRRGEHVPPGAGRVEGGAGGPADAPPRPRVRAVRHADRERPHRPVRGDRRLAGGVPAAAAGGGEGGRDVPASVSVSFTPR